MKPTVPTPTAGVVHRPDHAAEALDKAEAGLAAIDRVLAQPPPAREDTT